jgi:hypothetical protein
MKFFDFGVEFFFGYIKVAMARQDMQKTAERQGSLARTRPAEKCLEETGQTCKL